ncbi:DNA mismatch repair protein MutS [uncultured Porphyromonas sp.]|uniref:DNA mismatch repair protein MutS n=1 Tax=uncultured Porphyromonas sp. TaxID=159274 RepID=UPI0025949F85|nr:DNA mismatch repair protein MutS [uncultured Porphyromonas sp.]
MAKKVSETPMMAQFRRFKEQSPGALLLFRVGDFYETFNDDAVEVSRLLNITLTKRGDDPMAGFPHHALDNYLPKLVRKGKRVAICDQMEDPKLAKKLVKRAVTEVVTPGLTMDDSVLEADTNNFLAAIALGGGKAGIALLDLSTGEFVCSEGSYDEIDKLLTNFNPKEVLVKRGTEHEVQAHFGERLNLYPLEDWTFSQDYGRDRLLKHFEVKHLKAFGIEHEVLAIISCGAILYYLEATHHSEIQHINTIHKIEENRFVQLDRFTLRNLEILQPLNEDGNSLISVINHTRTPMGGRLLKRWLVFPLLDAREIAQRQAAVTAFLEREELRHQLSEILSEIGDLERLASKVSVLRINPRELRQLAGGLRLVKPIMGALYNTGDASLKELSIALDPLEELAERIERTINEETPNQLGKGNVIAKGFDSRLDELRDILSGSKEYLLDLRNRESERTGIPSLKVAYNNVFGYYIEVRNTHKDKVPEEWIRKQTLTQAERFITPELKEYEGKILGAEEKIQILENEIYDQLLNYVRGFIKEIQSDATVLSQIDVLSSFAEVASLYGYACPVVDNGDTIDIEAGRHPVIERLMPPGESYIPNDLFLDNEVQQILIITGPNMAGKSALLRQTALIVLLAQVGSYVPASAAKIGIVDRIFTRVGASDNISRGESTFMVEMTEAATILNGITNRSLVLVDELGRGTSTYDGISIAQAIVEYIHDHPRGRAKTLFATHYHELNDLERHFARVKNYNVTVQEVEGKIIFLRKLVAGGSEHSFGIHVAKLAGMPKEIIGRAEEILTLLEESARERDEESGRIKAPSKPRLPEKQVQDGPVQLSFFQLDDPLLSQVREEIVGLDLNQLTPIDALNKLNNIQRLLTGGKEGIDLH